MSTRDELRQLLAGASVRMNGLSLLGYVVMTVMVCAWFLGARKGLWR